MKSLSESTLRQYEITYKLWWHFCNTHGFHVFNSEEKEVLSFLHYQYSNKKLKYGSFNTYRSALSLILNIDFQTQHNLRRFMKGIRKLRPSQRKYNYIWDPKLILKLLETKFPNESLSLINLTKKTIVLLALITGHRLQTLARIKVDNIIISPEGIQVLITDIIKTSFKNKENPCLHIPYYLENPALCAASCLEAYIHQTASMRSPAQDYLFLTTRPPYRTATTGSLSRWIKTTLAEAGIDTTIFSGYSTRHASCSAAYRNGVTLNIIRQTAGWTSNSQTFARHYNLPVKDNPNTFAKAVLQ